MSICVSMQPSTTQERHRTGKEFENINSGTSLLDIRHNGKANHSGSQPAVVSKAKDDFYVTATICSLVLFWSIQHANIKDFRVDPLEVEKETLSTMLYITAQVNSLLVCRSGPKWPVGLIRVLDVERFWMNALHTFGNSLSGMLFCCVFICEV